MEEVGVCVNVYVSLALESWRCPDVLVTRVWAEFEASSFCVCCADAAEPRVGKVSEACVFTSITSLHFANQQALLSAFCFSVWAGQVLLLSEVFPVQTKQVLITLLETCGLQAVHCVSVSRLSNNKLRADKWLWRMNGPPADDFMPWEIPQRPKPPVACILCLIRGQPSHSPELTPRARFCEAESRLPALCQSVPCSPPCS